MVTDQRTDPDSRVAKPNSSGQGTLLKAVYIQHAGLEGKPLRYNVVSVVLKVGPATANIQQLTVAPEKRGVSHLTG